LKHHDDYSWIWASYHR